MQESNLLLEVGAQALSDLSASEKSAILAKYEDGQEKIAGMKVFNILSKKFQSDYRMGRMYEDLSQKYEAYRQLYREYAQAVKAGRFGIDPSTKTTYSVDRQKFLKGSRSPDDN